MVVLQSNHNHRQGGLIAHATYSRCEAYKNVVSPHTSFRTPGAFYSDPTNKSKGRTYSFLCGRMYTKYDTAFFLTLVTVGTISARPLVSDSRLPRFKLTTRVLTCCCRTSSYSQSEHVLAQIFAAPTTIVLYCIFGESLLPLLPAQ